MDFEIFLIYIAFILDRCYCAISLKNGQVLLLIFGLVVFRNPFLVNQFKKIVDQETTKGNLKIESRKFITLPFYDWFHLHPSRA